MGRRSGKRNRTRKRRKTIRKIKTRTTRMFWINRQVVQNRRVKKQTVALGRTVRGRTVARERAEMMFGARGNQTRSRKARKGRRRERRMASRNKRRRTAP